ncbi:MAG: hypothetical protein OK456_01620 [Thaumarchaeota archaeon]|nr:hypothetical protein [Nitrososphaerota archaeon]
MKCYLHPNVDAVGVCSECGRGVCVSCATSVKGKLYCRNDFGKVRLRNELRAKADAKRPPTLTIASVLFVLYGVGELALAILLMYTGVVPSAAKGPLDFFGTGSSVGLIDSSISIAPLIAGGVLFVASAAGMLTGDWLWRRRKFGVALGSFQIVLGLIITGALYSYSHASAASDVAVGVIALNVVLAALTAAGYRSLR